MARIPPTLVDSDEVSDWQGTGTSKSTGSVSWQTGDRIIVIGGIGDESSTLGTPTASGLSFSLLALTNNPSGNFCDAWVWMATAGSNGSGVINGSKTSGGSGWGLFVIVVRGSEGTATEAVNTSTTKTISLNRSQAESAVLYCAFDWSASSATATFTPGGAISLKNEKEGSSYTCHIGYWPDQDAAGSTNYGVTSSSSGSFAKIAIEILGTEEAVSLGDVIVGGTKKAVVSEHVIVGGVKKAVVNKWVIVGGVKKSVV